MTVQLCRQFPALDPIRVRMYPAHEVFRLVARFNKQQRRVPAKTDQIRRPAGDDWF